MVTLFLFGDSTCQTNLLDTYPQHGWGQVIPEYLNEDVRVINLARNGRSTKSFITEERYEPALRNIKKVIFSSFNLVIMTKKKMKQEKLILGQLIKII